MRRPTGSRAGSIGHGVLDERGGPGSRRHMGRPTAEVNARLVQRAAFPSFFAAASQGEIDRMEATTNGRGRRGGIEAVGAS